MTKGQIEEAAAALFVCANGDVVRWLALTYDDDKIWDYLDECAVVDILCRKLGVNE